MATPIDFTGIVQTALQKKTLTERFDYLNEACGPDTALRNRVEQAIRAQLHLSDSLALESNRTEQVQRGDPEGESEKQHKERELVAAFGALKYNDAQQRPSFLPPSSKPASLGRMQHYEILQVIGQGGMGVVLKAFDEKLHRVVAIKVMARDLVAQAESHRRFVREARTAAAVNHENVVTIHAVEEEHQPPFLVMQFVEGISLEEKIGTTGPLPLKDILRIARQIAEGLAAAHKQGLVHRDIKPANILLEGPEERVKITDFGLARMVNDAQITRVGEVTGTPVYMSPEQGAGEAVDHRSDLFSLGSVIYEMCVARPPFTTENPFASIIQVIEQEPTPIAKLNPAIPGWLCDIIAKLHAKKPEDRYQTAGEVAELLGKNLAYLDNATVVMPTGMMRRGRARTLRQSVIVAAGFLLLACGALMTAPYLRPQATTLTVHCPEGNVQLWIDGEPKANLGEATVGQLPVPPGEHLLTVKRGDEELYSERFVLQSGSDAGIQAKWLPKRFTNGIGMLFALVPKGRAWLGSKNGKVGDIEVTIDGDFYLGAYEVTHGEWEKIMGPKNNPSHYSRTGSNQLDVIDIADDDLQRFPVDSLSWDQSQEFLKKLNQRVIESGWTYRLPTVVEWEYACRGGPLPKKEDYRFDYYVDIPTNTLPANRANYSDTGLQRPCKVGSYPPNRLGLYDMHGNVFELCNDVHERDGGKVVEFRGGAWNDSALYCRASRGAVVAAKANYTGSGMRVARVPAGNSGGNNSK